MIVIKLVLAYAGMVLLCLAMDRHYRQVANRLPGRRLQIILRLAGWGTLALLFALCVNVWGWPVGSVAWFGMLSAGALLLVFMLPYAPRLAVIGGAGGFLPALAGTVLFLAG